MENDWIPEGNPVLDLVPPEFKLVADEVFMQNLGGPEVDKDSFWIVYSEMRDAVEEKLRSLPPSFKTDMGTVLRDNNEKDEEELPLLEGYSRLCGRPNRDPLEEGNRDGEWDASSDDSESDDYDEALYDVELTDVDM